MYVCVRVRMCVCMCVRVRVCVLCQMPITLGKTHTQGCTLPTLMAQWSMPLLFCFQSYNSLKRIFTIFFSPFFGLKKPDLQKKKCFFAQPSFFLVYPPYTLSGPTTKKTFFYVCLPLGKPQKKVPPLMARPYEGGGVKVGPLRKK